ncbi:hypothetical protein BKA56DRAFT_613409 [Ilyonectria sp. MPI-CAGE-AT-0026]|nr:hypothetical protein BKA56DRAFT_613409 [Ilyonectria sp. MPI-CAGE-AT-0026]
MEAANYRGPVAGRKGEGTTQSIRTGTRPFPPAGANKAAKAAGSIGHHLALPRAGWMLDAGWPTWAADSSRWARVCLHAPKGFYRRPITSPVQGNTEFAVWVPGSAAVAHHTSGDEARPMGGHKSTAHAEIHCARLDSPDPTPAIQDALHRLLMPWAGCIVSACLCLLLPARPICPIRPICSLVIILPLAAFC